MAARGRCARPRALRAALAGTRRTSARGGRHLGRAGGSVVPLPPGGHAPRRDRVASTGRRPDRGCASDGADPAVQRAAHRGWLGEGARPALGRDPAARGPGPGGHFARRRGGNSARTLSRRRRPVPPRLPARPGQPGARRRRRSRRHGLAVRGGVDLVPGGLVRARADRLRDLWPARRAADRPDLRIRLRRDAARGRVPPARGRSDRARCRRARLRARVPGGRAPAGGSPALRHPDARDPRRRRRCPLPPAPKALRGHSARGLRSVGDLVDRGLRDDGRDARRARVRAGGAATGRRAGRRSAALDRARSRRLHRGACAARSADADGLRRAA